MSESSYNLTLTSIGGGTNVIAGLGTPNFAYALDLATNLTPPINWMPQITNTTPVASLSFTNVTRRTSEFLPDAVCARAVSGRISTPPPIASLCGRSAPGPLRRGCQFDKSLDVGDIAGRRCADRELEAVSGEP